MQSASAAALAVGALIVLSTDIAIITGTTAVFVNTAIKGIAFIRGAGIPVVTIHRHHTLTFALITDVSRRTGIIVVTQRRIALVLAPGAHATAVIRTRIAITAAQHLFGLTATAATVVTGGAGIVVVALRAVGGIDTPGFGITAVVRAGVLIVTCHGRSALAG